MTLQTKRNIVMNGIDFNIELPDLILEAVEFLFLDGDSSNALRGNMTYRFKDGPVECPFYVGFYYVPGFSRYIIDRLGTLRVVKTGRIKKWSISSPVPEKGITGGYFVSHAIDDWGMRKGVSRHRLLCLTFKSYDVHPGHLWVNHVDGVPGSDDLDNLELDVPGQNIQHAYDTGLLPKRRVEIDALNHLTQERFSFPSIKACSQSLELPYQLVSQRLTRGNERRYPDGWRFKHSDESWLELNHRAGIMTTVREVVAKNVHTEAIVRFSSVSEAGEGTGVDPSSIVQHQTEKSTLPNRGWLFRNPGEDDSWPQYSERHKAIFLDRPIRPGDGIIAVEAGTGNELFFVSPEQAGQHFDISPITARKLAHCEGLRCGYRFKLFRIRVTSQSLSQAID